MILVAGLPPRQKLNIFVSEILLIIGAFIAYEHGNNIERDREHR